MSSRRKPAAGPLARTTAGRGPSGLAAPPALVAASLEQIEQAIGGREALVAALAHAPSSRDLTYVLGLVGDPRNLHLPLASICAMGGITAGELLEAYKSGEILRGHVLATRAIVAGLPAVISDTMRLAAPYEDTCYGCQGLGQVTPDPTKKVPNPEPETCETCQGSGRLLYKGDLDHKKLALELAQMTSKGGGGVSVQIDQRQAHLHAGGEAAGGTLEALLQASDRILYGDGGAAPAAPAAPAPEVVDGEVSSTDQGPSTDPEQPDQPDSSSEPQAG